MAKNITPPTIRKPFTDMPKKLNKSCPAKANMVSAIKAVKEALKAILRFNFRSNSELIVTNTGTVPSGFISARKLVNENRLNDIKSLIFIDL